MCRETWTAADGFSGTQGTDQWYYETQIHTLLVWVNDRWQEAADMEAPYIGRGVMHPGLVGNRAHDAVLRWDAPHAGTIRITGRVSTGAAPRGDAVRARITRNHTKVWPPGGSMADAWTTVDEAVAGTHDLTLAVNAGDQIRFVVNTDGPVAFGDSTTWSPTIHYTAPLPAPEAAPTPPTAALKAGDGSLTFFPAECAEVLINPDKGWVAYESEGNLCKGGGNPEYMEEVVVEGDTLADVPISDIYTRIAWSCFESGGEGVYDWSWLDSVLERFERTGRTFSLRVAAYGYWGPTPPDLCFGVPPWVEEAGAQGEFVFGNQWRPVADDPVFLEKLTAFMNAMGERYGGRDDISYIDLGSLGRWGEGHSHEYDLATFQKHWEILENAFPGKQLVANDDMGPECYNWACDERGAWMRDDSPYRWDAHSFPCMRGARLDRPNILETRHIHEWQRHEDLPNPPWQMIKEDMEAVFACRSAPVAYAGIHHYARDFMNNMGRDWVEHWANKMGYWFIVKQVRLPSPLVPGAANTLELEVENRGIDIVHRGYRLALALTKVGEDIPAYRDVAVTSDARAWLQGQTTTMSYTWTLGELPAGDYDVDLALVAPDGSDMRAVVKFGNHGRLAHGYMRLGTASI